MNWAWAVAAIVDASWLAMVCLLFAVVCRLRLLSAKPVLLLCATILAFSRTLTRTAQHSTAQHCSWPSSPCTAVMGDEHKTSDTATQPAPVRHEASAGMLQPLRWAFHAQSWKPSEEVWSRCLACIDVRANAFAWDHLLLMAHQ